VIQLYRKENFIFCFFLGLMNCGKYNTHVIKTIKTVLKNRFFLHLLKTSKVFSRSQFLRCSTMWCGAIRKLRVWDKVSLGEFHLNGFYLYLLLFQQQYHRQNCWFEKIAFTYSYQSRTPSWGKKLNQFLRLWRTVWMYFFDCFTKRLLPAYIFFVSFEISS
jgi:hypothetical protein